MDQRAHMQHQTDILEAQARGKRTRGHIGSNQRRLEVVGPTCQSADHHGPDLHRPPAFRGSFLLPSLRRYRVPCVVQPSASSPLSSPYKYERRDENEVEKSSEARARLLFSLLSSSKVSGAQVKQLSGRRTFIREQVRVRYQISFVMFGCVYLTYLIVIYIRMIYTLWLQIQILWLVCFAIMGFAWLEI